MGSQKSYLEDTAVPTALSNRGLKLSILIYTLKYKHMPLNGDDIYTTTKAEITKNMSRNLTSTSLETLDTRLYLYYSGYTFSILRRVKHRHLYEKKKEKK